MIFLQQKSKISKCYADVIRGEYFSNYLNFWKILTVLVMLIGFVGCRNNIAIDTNGNLIKIDLISDTEVKSFNVEIADDYQGRAKGLMYRAQLADDSGMLFVFPQETYQSFWMKNTEISLDLLFFDSQGKLVDYKNDFLPCLDKDVCMSYVSKNKAKYVLEVNSDVLDEEKNYTLKIKNQ